MKIKLRLNKVDSKRYTYTKRERRGGGGIINYKTICFKRNPRGKRGDTWTNNIITNIRNADDMNDNHRWKTDRANYFPAKDKESEGERKGDNGESRKGAGAARRRPASRRLCTPRKPHPVIARRDRSMRGSHQPRYPAVVTSAPGPGWPFSPGS